MVLKRYPKNEIPNSLEPYLDMCQKAKDILGKNHVFDKGDFFYHPDIGISTVDVNLGDGSFYCTGQSLFDRKINAKECTWLPSKKQLKNLIKKLNPTQKSLSSFLGDKSGDGGYPKGIKPKKFFKKTEERRLAYYMLEKHQVIWSKEKKEWLKT
ncbi:MAG: hypothetical protein ACQERH_09380 [Acidobacteriota bacterium]